MHADKKTTSALSSDSENLDTRLSRACLLGAAKKIGSIKSRGSIQSGNTKFNTKLSKLLNNVAIKDGRSDKARILENVPETQN